MAYYNNNKQTQQIHHIIRYPWKTLNRFLLCIDFSITDNTFLCNTCRTGLPWKYFRTSPHSKRIFLCNTFFNAYILYGKHKYNRWNKSTCCNNNLFTLYFYFFCYRITLSEQNRYKNGEVEEYLTKIQPWYLLKLRLYFIFFIQNNKHKTNDYSIWIFGKIHPVLLPELQNFQSL